MTLNSTGLGIGTISPAANLHAAGNALVTGNLSIGTLLSSANIGVSGTFGQSSKTLSSNATLSDHSLYFIDTSAGNLNLILPQASVCSGRMITVKKITTSNNVIIIDHANADIEGQGYVVLDSSSTPYPTIQFLSNGSAWYITNRSTGASSVAQAGFITTWKTDDQSGSGNTGSTQIKLPIYSGGTYNFQVFWGDGSFDTVTAYNGAGNTHTYSVAGTYKVRIVGTCWGWQFMDTYDRKKLYNIQQWGSDFRLVNAVGAFRGCNNLTITATDNLNLTGSTSLTQLFYDCTSLTTAPTMALWNTSAITTMNSTFRGCSIFNQPINNWDTGNVTNLYYLFAGCSTFNQPLNNWNSANVNILEGTFASCGNFNQSLDTWNTGKVTTLKNCFGKCTTFNQPLNNWNTANVTTLKNIFQECINFNQPLNSWDTRKVTELNYAFSECAAFNQPLNNWNSANVINMEYIFSVCTVFNQDLSTWNVNAVTSFRGAFNKAYAFKQNLSSWTPTSATDMTSMFLNIDMNATGTTTNYDALLNSWGAQGSLPSGMTFSGGSSKYSAAASGSRAVLTGTKGWTITDGGLLP